MSKAEAIRRMPLPEAKTAGIEVSVLLPKVLAMVISIDLGLSAVVYLAAILYLLAAVLRL